MTITFISPSQLPFQPSLSSPPAIHFRPRFSPNAFYLPPSPSASKSPVLILPGLFNSSSDYVPLANTLHSLGHPILLPPIPRYLWLLNARAFLLPSYWKSTLTPSQALLWYFHRLTTTLTPFLSENPSTPLSILGHSAGGWLARAYLSEHAPSNLNVNKLVTLGTPHLPPPSGSPDQTRGLLTYIDRNCDISERVNAITCVAGVGVIGGWGGLRDAVAWASYFAVCGKGNVDGDGVTPVTAACMPGAKEVRVTCEHSMLTSEEWYGERDVLTQWVDELQ